MIDKNELFDGVIGGTDLPEESARKDIFEVKDLVISSALDKQMARLLALHPQLQVKFRNNNLASLDDPTKQALLQDMQDILGITPLRNE